MAESNIPQKTGKELAEELGVPTIKFDGGQFNPMQDYVAEKTLNIKRAFLQLPIEERRKILAEQANDPEIITYYLSMLENHTHQCLESQVQSSKPIFPEVESDIEL